MSDTKPGWSGVARWWEVSLPARSLRREAVVFPPDDGGLEPDEGLFSIEVVQPEHLYGRDRPARAVVSASTVDGATGDACYVLGR